MKTVKLTIVVESIPYSVQAEGDTKADILNSMKIDAPYGVKHDFPASVYDQACERISQLLESVDK